MELYYKHCKLIISHFQTIWPSLTQIMECFPRGLFWGSGDLHHGGSERRVENITCNFSKEEISVKLLLFHMCDFWVFFFFDILYFNSWEVKTENNAFVPAPNHMPRDRTGQQGMGCPQEPRPSSCIAYLVLSKSSQISMLISAVGQSN